MDYQGNFKRYELKYIITKEQKEMILSAMVPYMRIDEFGKTTIRNVYFDTDNYRLIRHSIERPDYKEKLRLRSYGKVGPKDLVYVEIKKKYDSVVYKRRVAIPEEDAMKWLVDKKNIGLNSQIEKEINYFMSFYEEIKPEIFLSYDREGYNSLDESDFRITFDENIMWRNDRLSLQEDVGGTAIEDEMVIMEIKSMGAIPLWMTSILSKEQIYKITFSKYGKAYEQIIAEYI